MSTNQQNFEVALQLFTNAIFVVPTFQRPYAWTIEQATDLFHDISHASITTREHYLSPIHVIEIDGPQQLEWTRYADRNCNDISIINSSAFHTDDGVKQKIYFVIDGQQRLTTLYMIFVSVFGKNLSMFATFAGKAVPRVILNPGNDQEYFRQLFGLTMNTSAKILPSLSQKRLLDVFDCCKNMSVTINKPEKYVIQNGLKTLLISLNAQYGLQGFLTLNDRGKRLTDFEKLKSLIMEYDFTFGSNSNPHHIHTVFSRGYVALDTTYPRIRLTSVGTRDVSLLTDDKLLELLSIDVWMQAEVLNESSEKRFARYRAAKPDFAIVTNWLEKLSRFANATTDLTSQLNGMSGLPNTIYAQNLGRSVHDHYRVILDSLGLNTRGLAFLLKFRSEYSCDFHDKKYSVSFNNAAIITLLNDEIKSLLGSINLDVRLSVAERNQLILKVDSLNVRVSSKPAIEIRNISVLDVAEAIELFVQQMNSRRDFATNWKAAFDSGKTETQAFDAWIWFLQGRSARDVFFTRLFSSNIGDYRTVVHHLLAEYESWLRTSKANTSLAHSERLNIEHFLPHNSIDAMPPFPWNGIESEKEYYDINNSLGNLLLLDEKLNSALRDEGAPIKLAAYSLGRFVNTVATTKTEQSEQLVLAFGALTYTLKYNLRIRRLEILIFAMDRF